METAFERLVFACTVFTSTGRGVCTLMALAMRHNVRTRNCHSTVSLCVLPGEAYNKISDKKKSTRRNMHAFVILLMCSLSTALNWDFICVQICFFNFAIYCRTNGHFNYFIFRFFSLWSRIQIKHDFSLTLKNFNCKMQFIHRTGRAITGRMRLFTLCRLQCCKEKMCNIILLIGV